MRPALDEPQSGAVWNPTRPIGYDFSPEPPEIPGRNPLPPSEKERPCST